METTAKPKSNRAFGIGLAIVGLLFVGINIYLIEFQNQYFPKLICIGLIVFSLGLGLTIFPGGYVNLIEEKANFWKLKWKRSTVLDKIMWLLFIIGGVALCFLFFDYYNLSLV